MSENAGARQRLLIVDDSKVIRVTARKILRDHFETVEAVDGENGWETLNSEGPFSLIVSDLTMPRLDGFGLLERIRTSPQPGLRDIPVIIITGANDSEATKQRASQAGATDFISKPFDSVQLLARTQAHAGARTATETLRREAFTLEEQSLSDPLTGLANEAAFMDRGYQQLSYAIRHKTTLSVFLVEIDNYSELGQRHGGAASEALVKSVASTLLGEVRQEDLASRTGAARFALLLPGMNLAGIRGLSERISKGVSTGTMKHAGATIRITVSIGVSAPGIRRDTRFDDLLAEATRHLAQARRLGGNQAIFADSPPVEPVPVADQLVAVEAFAEELTLEMAAHADDMEIEIEAPAYGGEANQWPLEELPATECRQTSGNEPNPGLFAGPVPAMSGQGSAPAPGGRDGAAVGAGPAEREAAVPGARTAFDLENIEIDVDETIVITAPFDVHSGDEPEQQADRTREKAVFGNVAATVPAQTAAQAGTDTTAGAGRRHAQDGPVANVQEDHTEGDEPQDEAVRPGILRRLLRAMWPWPRRRRSART